MNEQRNSIWPGWETGSVLGRGGFSTVYAISRDNFGQREYAALKVISIPRDAGDIEELRADGYDDQSITQRFRSFLESIVREYNLMAKLKGHPNVVYCDDLRYIQHPDGIGWDIYIKMELLQPLTKSLPQQIPEGTVIKLAMDICAALELCRSQKIIHRDLKPQNIFVGKDGSFKLGDFGIAKTTERTTSGTKTGTYKYMAPEVYKGQPYGHRADIYSLGLVLYWMLNQRRTPFLPLPPQTPSVFHEDASRDRRFGGEPIPEPLEGSPELKRIVLKACAYDPRDRYATAAEMFRDLQALAGQGTAAAPVRMPVNGAEEATVGVFSPKQEDLTATQAHTEGLFMGWEERDRLRREEAARKEAEERRLREQARLNAEAEEQRRRHQRLQEQQMAEEKRRRELERQARDLKKRQKQSLFMAVSLVVVLLAIFFVYETVRSRVREATAYQPPAIQTIQAQEPLREAQTAGEVMTYPEYLAAPLDTWVVVETYALASLDVEDGKTCVYCQDPEGAYYVYNAECTEALSYDLYPGAPIRIEGYKGEWAGSDHIYNALITPLSGESYSASPSDIADFWSSDSLIRLQNRLVVLDDVTVTNLFFDSSLPQSQRDITIGLKYNGDLGDAQILRRLVGPDSELHQLAMTLKPGDQVTVIGYLNWYSGPNIHVVYLKKTG